MSENTATDSRGDILIVDDTLANLRLLTDMLRDHDYKVRGARSGQMAINAAQSAPPDLVLLDINMPEMDGYETCRHLQADERTGEVPIIFLSALDEALDKVKAFEVGGVDYITKPFQIEEVLVRIESQLKLSRLQAELRRTNDLLEERVEERTRELLRFNEAYERFVPSEFLGILQKRSILDVEGGDQVQREMTIMFADIRDFTPLSESMTPSENFRFLNGYMRQISPFIRQNQGFVDKFIGDEIMALFPRRPDDALRAAIDMLRQVALYNGYREKNGYAPIQVGISIHTGTLILGMIGEAERLEGTVISDAVNLASRLEGLTKVYGAGILISKQTLELIEDPDEYNVRFLDNVQVKGKKELVDIFELFDGDAESVRDLKLETKADFERGQALYKERNWPEALVLFQQVLARNPDDVPAQLYLKRVEIALSLDKPRIEVLLIDDQLIIGEAVRRMLAAQEDINFHFCQDAKEAIEMANKISPTVILQDLVMPDIDGLELLSAFRANSRTRDVPMIVLSGREDAKIKAEAFAKGANDYLIKLPDPVELIARIRYHSKGYISLLQNQRATHSMLFEFSSDEDLALS